MLAPPTAPFQAPNDPIGPLGVPPRAPEAPSRPSGSGDRRHHRLPTRPHHAPKAILFRQTWPDNLTHLSSASYYTYAPRRASSPSNLARYYPTAASAYYSLAPRTVACDQPRHQRSRSLTMASNGHASSPPGSPARSASISLQAAATMNASLQREPSPRSSSSSLARQVRTSVSSSRRRSNVLLNLQLNDPSIPAPGEMVQEGSAPTHLSPGLRSRSSSTADPNHHRAPSLGELHQELEAEQEGQVNRLLQVIRQQQLELQRIQAGQGASAEDSSAISERSSQAIPSAQSGTLSGLPPVGSFSRSPVFPHRGSMDLARRSRTPSRGASPRLRATSISQESGDWVLGVRDESAFYQAETQMLVRENQMLKHRIRELEKQLGDNPSLPATEPNVPSQLAQSSTTTESEAATSK